MGKYLLNRFWYMFLTLFLIATFSFFLMKLMPGSPLTMENKLTQEQLSLILDQYGLNDPLPVQYFDYMVGLAKGDMGISFQFDNRAVSDLIANRIGPSAQLGAQAMILGVIVGMILGIISAMRHNTLADYSSSVFAVIGLSVPSFVFAGLLQYVVGVKFGWLPVAFWEGPKYTVLPTLALMMTPLAVTARFTRTEMLEVLNADYITTAKAKGVNPLTITIKHTLRNALIPLITVIGPLAVGLMTGSIVIEQMFAIPGIGEQFIRSITMNDYPMIMGTTLFFAFFFILVVLVVDVLYGVIDPRIRLAKE